MNPDQKHLEEYAKYAKSLEAGEVNCTKDQAMHRLNSVKNCISIVERRMAEEKTKKLI